MGPLLKVRLLAGQIITSIPVMPIPGSQILLVPTQGTTAGLKFTATNPFYAINATCPTWADNIGNITLKLYAWSDNYTTSVAGIPLAEKTFINFNDNEKIQLSFDELPAGEYVYSCPLNPTPDYRLVVEG